MMNFRSWSGFLGLSISCAATAWVTTVGRAVLLHAAAHRFGLTVLYNGRFYHSHGRRMATPFKKKERIIHRCCLYHQLLCGADVHHPRRNVRVPDSRFICSQWFLPLVLNFLRMHINLLVLRNWSLLRWP